MNVRDKLLPELDLDNIVKKVATENNWSKDRALDVETQYRAFLKLNQMYPGVEFAPNSEIDEIWHTHILDTQKYAQDCDRLFGAILHHIPSYGDQPEEKNILNTIAENTQRLFKDNFGLIISYGEPNSDFANNALTCGGQTRCRTKTVKGLALG